jgi:two-component SAPR family response regulator
MLKLLSENMRIDSIEVFENYAEFITRVGKSPPDFCFVRLGKDGIPGLKVAGTVQQISMNTRVVFVSEDKSYAVDAYEVGAYGYLSPPLTKEKLDRYL